MFHTMNSKMIVTNVRMSKEDWLRVKAAAGEMGMSTNEYINYVVDRYSTFKTVPQNRKKKSSNPPSIWDLPKIAKRIKRKPMGWSDEDEAIYSV